jgi:hypothetical protein
VAYDVSINLNRRSLSSAQRAALAVELEPLFSAEAAHRKQILSGTRRNPNGSRPEKAREVQKNITPRGQVRDQVARLMGTNTAYVSHAKRVMLESQELFQEIKDGQLGILDAVRRLEKVRHQAEKTQRRPTEEAIFERIWNRLVKTLRLEAKRIPISKRAEFASRLNHACLEITGHN